jgi:hypothetical protein
LEDLAFGAFVHSVLVKWPGPPVAVVEEGLKINSTTDNDISTKIEALLLGMVDFIISSSTYYRFCSLTECISFKHSDYMDI